MLYDEDVTRLKRPRLIRENSKPNQNNMNIQAICKVMHNYSTYTNAVHWQVVLHSYLHRNH